MALNRKEYKRQWNLKNKERIAEQNRQWYLKNKERVKKRQKQYELKNKEKVKVWRKRAWKKYYEKNKEELLKKGKAYKKKNIEKTRKRDRDRYWDETKGRRERWLKYCRENREKINKRRRERYKNDLNYRIRCVTRAVLRQKVKKIKIGRIEGVLGCSLKEYREYLESKFKEGMSWENWSYKGWHIDHIIPLSYFDLTDPEQLKHAAHYTNTQPMWAMENHQKSSKILIHDRSTIPDPF